MKRSSEKFRDYTELVAELSFWIRQYGKTLSDVGGGDSRVGIDNIQDAALGFIDADKNIGVEWDGEWIECVQDYAYTVVKRLIDKETVPYFNLARGIILTHVPRITLI